jgi:hypothetical protein
MTLIGTVWGIAAAQDTGGSDYSGPLLIGLGAVIAAIITAVAAQVRLKSTLKGERGRLDVQLASQREELDRRLDAEHVRMREELAGSADRLREELAHDRRMRDLDDLRLRFDSAVGAAEAAITATLKAAVMVEEGKQDLDAIESELATAVEKTFEMGLHVQRGWTRVGFDTGLPEALNAWREALSELRPSVRAGLEPGAAFPGEDWLPKLQAVGTTQRKFIDIAHELLGSTLPAKAAVVPPDDAGPDRPVAGDVAT